MQTPLPANEMNAMQDLKIKFGGETHQIEANTFLNSLLAFTTIVQEVNRELSTNKRIEVKINALKEGSFWVDISLISNDILGAVASMFSIGGVSTTANIIQVVGGLYNLAKFSRGEKPKVIETNNETIKIENNSGNVTIVDNRVYNIYQTNKQVRSSISQGFNALEADDNVTGFELITTKNNEEEPIVQIDKNEFSSLAGSIETFIQENNKIVNKTVRLNIIKLSFDKTAKWEFYLDGHKINAKIKDNIFAEMIDNGESFSKGDALEADIEIKQEFDQSVDTYINKSYTVLHIINHIRRTEQSRLDFPKNEQEKGAE